MAIDYAKLNLVKVSNWFERLSHTLLAISFLLLAFTGLAFYSKKFAIFAELFGGLRMARVGHNHTAVLFMISVVLMFFALFKESCHFGSDDLKWMAKAGGYLWKAEGVPESGRFNPGQRLWYFFTIIMTIIMAVTGLVMWQAPTAHFNKFWVGICYPVHSLGGILFISGWLGHFYLATICNPGSLESMTYGWVTKPWLRLQHGKWFREHISGSKKM